MEANDVMTIEGRVRAVLTGPDGQVKSDQTVKNIITQIGRRYLTQRAAGIASPEGQVTGMKLGHNGTQAATVSGTGSFIASADYISGSQKALDGGFPTEAVQGSGSRLTWQASWAAGVATDADIEEVEIVNDALANAFSPEADTVARAVIAQVNKGAGDTLTVTWTWDIGIT